MAGSILAMRSPVKRNDIGSTPVRPAIGKASGLISFFNSVF